MAWSLLAAVLIGPARAQAWDLAGSSLRDVAMAGAGVAGELPGAALPVDPAAVAAIEGEVAALSWRGSFPAVQGSGGQELVKGAIHAVDLGLGLARPLGQDTAVGAGMQMYLPLPELVATVVHSQASDPQAPLLQDAADFAAFQLVAGVRLGRLELALGAGVGMTLLADTEITVLTLEGEQTANGFDISDAVTLDLERQLAWQAIPLVGAHYRGEGVDAYLSWRGRAGFETRGDQTLGLDIPVIEIDPVAIPVTYLSAWTPGRLTVGAGAAVDRLRPELVLRYVVASSFEDTQQQPPPEPFRDVLSPAAGLGVDLGHGVEGRAGYGLVPTPVPLQTGATRFGDATRHVLGLGGALALDDAPRGGDRTELALATQLQLLAPRERGFAATGHWLTVVAGVQSGF